MSGSTDMEQYDPIREQVRAEVRQAQQLVGAVVESVCHTQDFSSFGLRLQGNGKTVVAWVDCDPEGNGPGHLNLEEET